MDIATSGALRILLLSCKSFNACYYAVQGVSECQIVKMQAPHFNIGNTMVKFKLISYI